MGKASKSARSRFSLFLHEKRKEKVRAHEEHLKEDIFRLGGFSSLLQEELAKEKEQVVKLKFDREKDKEQYQVSERRFEEYKDRSEKRDKSVEELVAKLQFENSEAEEKIIGLNRRVQSLYRAITNGQNLVFELESQVHHLNREIVELKDQCNSQNFFQ